MKAGFLSDNSAPVHPSVLEWLARANSDYAPAYGDDALTHAVRERLGEVFEHEVDVWLTGTGTVANCLLLSALTPPYGAIFCHEECHLIVDESSAPAMFTAGARLVGVGGAGALIDPAPLDEKLNAWPVGDVHSVQPACIAVTQSSELGRVYCVDKLGAIAAVADRHGVGVFMDGARFANAVVSTAASPAELTWKRGVKALTFGTTKNGTLCAEAAVVFDSQLARALPYLHKRSGQLMSKMRYVAAQVHAMLEGDLWLDNARHANAMATRLSEALGASGHATVLHPVDANELFVSFSPQVHARLVRAGYRFNEVPAYGTRATRLVTSWATQSGEIDALVGAMDAG